MSITQKKGFISIVAVFTLLIGCFVTPGILPVSAANTEYTLTASDVTYEDLGDGNIRLTGLADTYNDDAQAKPYTIVIPNEIDGYTVTSISGGSEKWASEANTISFEENSSVEEIQSNAFAGYSNLKYIEIPANATDIGSCIFAGNSMTSVTFNENYKKNSFSIDMFGNANFEYVKLPEQINTLTTPEFWGRNLEGYITTLDYGENSMLSEAVKNAFKAESGAYGVYVYVENVKNAPTQLKILNQNALFYSDSHLKSFKFADGAQLEEVSDSAFYGTSIKELILPETTTKIGPNAFNNSGISLIYAPGVKEIHRSAFYMSNLATYTFSENITLIDTQSFSYSKISTFDFPENIDTIPAQCFQGCKNLKQIKLHEGIKAINNNAFEGCNILTDIKLPDSLLHIYNGAFSGCTQLNIPLSVNIETIGNEAFKNTGINNVYIPDNVKVLGASAFYGCSSLTDINLNSVEIIGASCFHNTGLISVTIPDTVHTINNQAFYGCRYLQNVTISEFSNWKISSDNINQQKFTGIFTNCNSLTEIRLPKSLGVVPQNIISGSGVKKMYIQGRSVALGYTPFSNTNAKNCRIYFAEDTILAAPIAATQLTGAENYNAIFVGDNETYTNLTANGLKNLTNVYRRATDMELTLTPTQDDLTLTATLTADGTPDNRIVIYIEHTDGTLQEVAVQNVSSGKTLTKTIPNAELPVGNLKYIARYEPTDPDGWYASEDIEWYDKGVANCRFGTITLDFSQTGDLILGTPVICDETPRGTIKVYLGENATGKLLATYPASTGRCSISHADLPYGDNEIFIEFIPSDVGMSYCNTSTNYVKTAEITTLNATVSEYNNTVFVNTNVEPAQALTEGEVSIYLGDEITGVRMNDTGKTFAYIHSSYLKQGDNLITVVYQSPDGHFTYAKETLNYNFTGGEPTLSLNIYTEKGFVHFSAVLENYKTPPAGTIKIYKGYDNTGELIYGGAAPSASTKFSLAEYSQYGNQTYYAEYISSDLNNKDAKTIETYSRDSKGTSITAEVTTVSDTAVRVAAKPVDSDGNPVTKGILSIYRGSTSAGVLIHSGTCDGNTIETLVDRNSLQIGANEFFIVYEDDTLEYSTCSMSVIYTRLSTGEGGTELDNIYSSYEEKLRQMQLMIEENNKNWLARLDELEESLSAGADLGDLTTKLDELESALGDLNLKLDELEEIKSLIKNIKVEGGGSTNVDIDLDEIESIVKENMDKQLEEIKNLIEKLNNKEVSLSEKDLQYIKDLIEQAQYDYSDEFRKIDDRFKQMDSEFNTISNKIDNIRIPDYSDISPDYSEIIQNITKQGNQNSESVKQVKNTMDAQTKELMDKLASMQTQIELGALEYQELQAQLEDMSRNNTPWWAILLIILLILLVIICGIYIVSLRKKLNKAEEINEEEQQIKDKQTLLHAEQERKQGNQQ